MQSGSVPVEAGASANQVTNIQMLGGGGGGGVISLLFCECLFDSMLLFFLTSLIQLEWESYEMGAVLPYSPHHHRPVPVPGRGEGSAGGRPGEGQHQAVGFLLPHLKGQKGPFQQPSVLSCAPDISYYSSSSHSCVQFCLSLTLTPSRRRWMWLRSVMLRGWAFRRSSMESPCASYSMYPQASGSHTQPWMPRLLVWG